METGTDIYDSLECNRKWTPMKQMQARKKVEDHGAAKVGLPLSPSPAILFSIQFPSPSELPIVQRVV